MDYTELKSLIPLAGFILDSLYADFQADEEEGDPRRFLHWLREQEYLDQDTFRAVIARLRVDVGTLPAHSLGPADDASPGWRLDIEEGLDLLEEIDRGGSGEIRLARERDLQRTVAFKRLLPEAAASRDAVARFFREVQITAQLEHPNIVPVYRLLVEDGRRLAYTMKLIEGRTLAKLIEETRELCDKKRPIDSGHDLATRLGWFLKVCDAVAYAHSKGIIHRDLKPANVMVGAFGEVYVMDWGIARRIHAPLDRHETAQKGDVALADAASSLHVDQTRHGLVVGTPSHMSPEQAEGDPTLLDGRSDLYSLGLVLFELVSLRRAIPGKDSRTVWANALAGNKNELVHHAGVRIPPELGAIIDRATQEEPDQRYPSVEAFAQDLRSFLQGKAVQARPDGPLQAAARWLGHHRELALSAVVVLLLGLVLTVTAASGALLWYRAHARAREQALGAMLTAVSEQGHHIDTELVRYEGLLRGLAAAAVQARRTPLPDCQQPGTCEGLFLASDYETPSFAPPDLTWSDRYRMSISLDYPVFKLAPGLSVDDPLRPVVTEDEVQPGPTFRQRLAQMAPLGNHFRRMMLNSMHDRPAPEETRSALLSRGAPLVWTYVGLADGVHMAYPGKGGYPADFDPRKRPWYQLGQAAPAPVWGSPYVDKLGQGLILPCAMALVDDDGTFVGVAGVEFTFRTIIDELMALPGVEGVRETFLLDQEARIVVRSEGLELPLAEGSDALRLDPFPYADVVPDLRAGRSGYAEVRSSDGDAFVFFAHLDAFGWSYAVLAEKGAVLRGG